MILSISANRTKLPSTLELQSSSALSALCNEITRRSANNVHDALVQEFSEGIKNDIFELSTATTLFDRKIFVQRLNKKSSSHGDELKDAYYQALLKMDEEGIRNVSIAPLGTGSCGYSLEESIAAFNEAFSVLPLENIQQVQLISLDFKTMHKIIAFNESVQLNQESTKGFSSL